MSSGSGGTFEAYVEYGNFYSSGTVLMNGGNGTYGGDTEYYSENRDGYSCYIETAYSGNTSGNGDIMEAQHVDNSGSLTANGGDGTITGGSGGTIALISNDAGTPTTNPGTLSVAGGAPDGSVGTINIDGGGGPI